MKRIKMIAKRVIVNPHAKRNTPIKQSKKRSDKMEKRLALKRKVEDSIKKVRASFKEKIKSVKGKDAKDALRKKRDAIIKKLEVSYTKSYKKNKSKKTNIENKKIKKSSKKDNWWKRAVNKIKGFFK